MPRTYPVTRLPIIVIGPSIAYVPLTRNQYALIDSEDAEKVSTYSWFAHPQSHSAEFYAMSNTKQLDGKRKTIHMHRFVLDLDDSDSSVVDHVNSYGLDNRKSNVRPATIAQNRLNCRVRSDSKSGVKGVRFSRGKWDAKIHINGKKTYIGRFETKEAAARAYTDHVANHHGEFGRAA